MKPLRIDFAEEGTDDGSLDSMETVFSSDETFAEIADPVFQKIIEADVKDADPVLEDINLGFDETKKNDFFKMEHDFKGVTNNQFEV